MCAEDWRPQVDRKDGRQGELVQSLQRSLGREITRSGGVHNSAAGLRAKGKIIIALVRREGCSGSGNDGATSGAVFGGCSRKRGRAMANKSEVPLEKGDLGLYISC